MNRRFRRSFWFSPGLLLIFALSNFAADWPMWRYDAGRTASSPEELATVLNLLWVRDFGPREPVWDDPLNQDLMPFDQIFEPIVAGKQIFLGFNDGDKVIALSTETGELQWEFFVDGPVRLPLAAWQNRLYFTSDDGWLYCLAHSGELVWKFRGAPAGSKILGNKRLISAWPARGGVVIQDGIVYFGASIWPLMGTFLYALDAQTGQVIWHNSGTGATYMKQPHDSPAFAGVAPQGAMAISRDFLLVSGGRSVPAVFNRHSGEFIYYHLAANNKTGGAFVCANDDYFFNHSRNRNTTLYNLEQGYCLLPNIGDYPVINRDVFYFSGKNITVRPAKSPDDKLAEYPVDASGDLIKAGACLYAAGNNQITAFRPPRNGEDPEIKWQKSVEGRIARLVAGDGKLFAVTFDGKILAFGPETHPSRHFPHKKNLPDISARTRAQVRQIVDQTEVTAGYALVWGIERDDFLPALAEATELNLVALEASSTKIQKWRRQLDAAGLYGKRVHLLGTPESANLPPYFASLIIINQTETPPPFPLLFKSLRPYGGKMWLPDRGKVAAQIDAEIRNHNLPGAEIISEKNAVIISRNGPLPGASDWTHQYGDIANTVKSDDELVQLPLGVLWFGGNSNVDVLPRHGHGPPEQVIGGRLFIPGMDRLSARDVYTGRVLWNTIFDSCLTAGVFFDDSYKNTPLVPTYNQEHIPGANARGTIFVAGTDFVYVIKQDSCLVLDAATGQPVRHFIMPPAPDRPAAEWGFIGMLENNLIAGADFVSFAEFNPAKALDDQEYSQLPLKKRKGVDRFQNYDVTASKRLLLIDRFDGAIHWEQSARYGFLHNAIVATPGRIFCLDKLPPFFEQKFERRGLSLPGDFRLLALDAQSGKIIWEATADIFGSWLGVSEEYHLLLQATRPSRDMLSGEEGKRMIVYDAATGVKIWDEKISYNNPPILHHRKIITDNAAYDLFTGQPIQQIDPLTHERIPWSYSRTYGCNYNIASEHLLSFRSAAAGFYDLAREGGTGNLGGFKSGCTSNLVAADGVLNAPDYTRTCQCSYQNQTSLALVHYPDLEYWMNTTLEWNKKPIRQLGLNFYAPGDRLAKNKTLWLDIPSVGGDSPEIQISLAPENHKGVRLHSAFVTADSLPWVAASAITGVNRIAVTLASDDSLRHYTVILYFAELERKAPGERVFDVRLQGEWVLRDLDVVKTAGMNTSITRIFKQIPVQRELKLEFAPSNLAPQSPSILCGMEIIVED